MKVLIKDIKKNIPHKLYETLKEFNGIIAGGFIVSVLRKVEINDIDIYFKNVEDCLGFIEEFIDDVSIVCLTDKAVTMNHSGVTIQVIFDRFYHNATEIFKTFDFSCCMASFDVEQDELYLHENFLIDNTRMELNVNGKTSYPLMSLMRVNKYINKGYFISRKELLKLSLQVTKLDIKDWGDLGKHIGGMYGLNISKFFDKKEPFDLDVVIDKLSDIDSSHFESNIDKTYPCLTEVISTIKDRFGLPILFYKNVKKTDIDGLFKSYYDSDFEYKLGEIVSPKTNCSHGGGIYFGLTPDYLPNYQKNDHVTIIITPQNFNDIRHDKVVGNVKVVGYIDSNGNEVFVC